MHSTIIKFSLLKLVYNLLNSSLLLLLLLHFNQPNLQPWLSRFVDETCAKLESEQRTNLQKLTDASKQQALQGNTKVNSRKSYKTKKGPKDWLQETYANKCQKLACQHPTAVFQPCGSYGSSHPQFVEGFYTPPPPHFKIPPPLCITPPPPPIYKITSTPPPPPPPF